MSNAAIGESAFHERVPLWTLAAGAALGGAASRVQMIAATTPWNLRAELDRLAASFRLGSACDARFEYRAPAAYGELIDGLLRAADALDERGELGAIYAAKARELADEARVCSLVGQAELRDAARRRFSPRDSFDSEADALARAWLGEEREDRGARGAGELVRSDDERDPRSLVSAMRRAVGERRLPSRVVVLRDLAPLAATGEGVVQVAAGRMLSPRDVARTVLHEIEGHAAPSERGRTHALSIFAIGTARGSDDQEGRALAIERAAGFLDAGRRRELALRHVAARAVEGGADFAQAARMLLELGAPAPDALRIAARVVRGGGLAREAVYLPALLRVEAARRADPRAELVLRAGRVAVNCVPELRAWVT